MKKTLLAAFAFLALSTTSALAQYGRTDPRPQPGSNNGSYDANPNYGGANNGYNNGGYNNGSYNNRYGTNGSCNSNGYNNGYGSNGYGNNGYSYVRSHPIYRNVLAARLPLYEQRGVMRELQRIEQMEWAFGRNGRIGRREEAVLARELAQLDARLQRDYRRGYVRY